jgi:urease accessory protein
MLRSLTLTTALVMASPMALAHGNGDTGFWSGLVHIVTSVDHLMSMVALGIWSATAGRKYQTGLVCTTPLLLLIGLMTGMLTGWVASADLAIALAILMIGVLIASGVHFQQKQWVPALSAFAFAAIFVLINGIAHICCFWSGPDSRLASR